MGVPLVFYYSYANLIDVELLNQIQIGAFPIQVSLSYCLHSLLLQTVHHVVEGVLVW